MVKVKAKVNKRTCSKAGRGLKVLRSSRAGKFLGKPCKKRAAKIRAGKKK